MMRTLAPALFACICVVLAPDVLAQAKPKPPARSGQAWTLDIPQAFPGNIYVWCLKPDGTYTEGGRDASSGDDIQDTQKGTWTSTKGHMVLRQTSNGAFVFDGTVKGDTYSGKLYLDGKEISPFNAKRGADNAPGCGDPQIS